jgi:hypothetical protein
MGDDMNGMSGPDRPLPADRAFVVQMHAGADVHQGRLVGRAVHVVSGQAVHFDSLEALLTFIGRVLASLAANPPAEHPEGS